MHEDASVVEIVPLLTKSELLPHVDDIIKESTNIL